MAHVVNYRVPMRVTLPFEDLRKHLHTLPEQPDLTPYRTASLEAVITHKNRGALAQKVRSTIERIRRHGI